MGYQKPPIGSKLNYGHPLALGIVGCWLFNEGGGSTILDSSGNNLHGESNFTAQTGSSGWNSGPNGYEYRLLRGSSQYISMGNSAQLKLNHFTLGISFTPTITAGYQDIIGNCYYDQNVGYKITLYQAQIYTTVMQQSVFSPTQLVAGRKHTAIATYDGVNLRLYVTPSAFLSAGRTATTSYNTTPFRIGLSPVDYLTAAIDYAFVYNRALNAAEVRHLMAFPYCMFEPAYPAWWWGVIAPEPPEPSTWTPRIYMIM
jgi:hypothetical protein